MMFFLTIPISRMIPMIAMTRILVNTNSEQRYPGRRRVDRIVIGWMKLS
jgi:hypothetical protein